MIVPGRTMRAVAIVRRRVWNLTGFITEEVVSASVQCVFYDTKTYFISFERSTLNRNQCVDRERLRVLGHAEEIEEERTWIRI
jgi:hypothetical protein